MRHLIAALFAAGLTLAAQAYPLVSNDPNNVQLNVWNTNLAQAKAKAKAENRPALLVMLDSVNCSFSKAWIANIADSAEWQTFLADNPLVLVMADKPKLDLNTWINYTAPFRDSGGTILFPTVVLFRPDGTVADQILARGTLGTSPGFYTRVRATTDQYPSTTTPPDPTAPGTIGFASATASVSEGAASVSVTVKRTGGSAGSQTFSYATANGSALAGANYTGTGGSLVWSDGDTSDRTVTVQLINDNTWTSPTARTFALNLALASGTATLGTASLTVTINEVTPPPVTVAPTFTAPTPASGSAVTVVQNTAVNIQTAASGSSPITFAATGLPAGLGINAGTGLISGTPTAAGSSYVTVTASNSKGTARTTFTLRVTSRFVALSGSYKGMFYDPDLQTVRGTLTLSASSTGSLMALVVLDGVSSTYTGKWDAGAENTADLHTYSGTGLLSIQVDALGILTGTFGEAALFGRRASTAGAPEFAGYYTALLGAAGVTPNSDEVNNTPEGYGYVTFTVGSLGSVSYKGALADGTLFSGASTLLRFSGAELADLGYSGLVDDQSYAFFPIYSMLYSRRGLVAGQIWIDGNTTSAQSDNKVFIIGSEWLYPGKSATATADGFTALFDDGLFTEIGAAFTSPANLSDAYDGTSFQVDAGSVPVQTSTLQTISLPTGNELNATLTASRTTGLFSGSFLYTPESGTPFTVRYTGVLVPAWGTGGGSFLVPDSSVVGYSLKRSKPVVIAP